MIRTSTMKKLLALLALLAIVASAVAAIRRDDLKADANRAASAASNAAKAAKDKVRPSTTDEAFDEITKDLTDVTN
jgi:hypothetical protein